MSAAPNLTEILDRQWSLLIGGRLTPAISGRYYDDESPVTEEVIAAVPDAGAADVEAAVQAAGPAAVAWRRVAARDRGAVVAELANVLERNAEELALLDAVDGGHPVTAMHADVAMAADTLRLFAGLAIEIKGATVPASAEHLHMTVREPFGVVGRIIPFNHPIMFAAGKIAAPLVAGNAVILKPPDSAPLSALRMGELIRRHPPARPAVGRCRRQPGGGPRARAPSGRAPDRLHRQRRHRAGHPAGRGRGRGEGHHAGTRWQERADRVRRRRPGPGRGRRGQRDELRRSAGQSCGSTSRLLLHESVADEVLDRVAQRMAEIWVGSPLDPDTEMGTLSSRPQYEKTLSYIGIGRDEGARLLAGGGRPPGLAPGPGLFVAPTLFGGVRPEMRLAREEVFGPVLSALTWKSEDEAVRSPTRSTSA